MGNWYTLHRAGTCKTLRGSSMSPQERRLGSEALPIVIFPIPLIANNKTVRTIDQGFNRSRQALAARFGDVFSDAVGQFANRHGIEPHSPWPSQLGKKHALAA